MNNKYYIVLGANGLLGSCAARILSRRGCSWMGTCFRRPIDNLVQLDVTKTEDLKDFLKKYNPDVIFHCANLQGGVDFCENHPSLAREFYLNSIKKLSEQVEYYNATLVIISTDYVFDGSVSPCKETDQTNPLNLYGRLKLEAEDWIRTNVKKHIIIRTTNVYGWDPLTVTPNYMMNLYRTIREGKVFNAPSFLWGNPTYVEDLANSMIEISEKKLKGTYHVVGPTHIDRYNWVLRACEILGLDSNMVSAIEVPKKDMIPRPFRLELDTHKFCSSFSTVLHDLSNGLELMKLQIEGERK